MKFIVVDKSAHMPSSCRGSYRRVGVVEVIDPAKPVSKLDTRDRNVARIVETWERLNVGTTEKCAYRVALASAEKLAKYLNDRENV